MDKNYQYHSVSSRHFKSFSTTAPSSTSSATPKNVLAADTGNLGTHIYHKVSAAIAFTTPIYLFAPTDSYPMLEKTFSLGLSGMIALHSWIGLNYVAADYVPKVSKSLLGPARVVVAGMGIVTFLGLGKISLSDENNGGIKGLMKGLWGYEKKQKDNEAN